MNYVCMVSGLIIVSVFIYQLLQLKKQEINSIHKKFQIKNFETYMILLEFVMKKSYEIIHKDRILIYSLESTMLQEHEYQAALKDFINLTLKFLGPSLKKELIDFFGDEENLLFNIAEYFNTTYEGDEVRRNATDNLMNNKNELDEKES